MSDQQIEQVFAILNYQTDLLEFLAERASENERDNAKIARMRLQLKAQTDALKQAVESQSKPT
jgi:hypothetical protein